MRRVKGDARNSSLRRFRRMIFSVAHDRVADRRKLHADLILQSRHQRNPHQRSAQKRTFDRVAELGASRFGVALCAQPLQHSFAPKVVYQLPYLGAEPSANHREILPDGSVGEKLPDQYISIQFSFRKEQNAGCKTINAMYDKGPLPLPFQFRGKKRPGGRSIGAFHGHRRKSGGLVERHQPIVFVKHGKFP